MLATALRFFLLVEIGLYLAVAIRGFALSPLAALFATVAVILGSRAGIVGVTYLAAQAEHSPAPRLTVMQWLRMAGAEYLAFLRLFLVIQPFERWWMGEDRLPPGRRVLLLVHGYGCNRGAWWWLRARLERAGYVVATLNLEPPNVAIDHYAEAIDGRLATLCRETGVDRLTLIGHSMGGLAARAYLRQHGGERVEQLITLATPHAGSTLARLGIGANARQMEAGSLWLGALGPLPGGLAAVSVRNSHDNFVMPQDNQRLDGARDVELPALGHLAMLFSPRLAQILLDALRR